MHLSPGACRSCDGPLQIIDADDMSLTVACADCADTYEVERPDQRNSSLDTIAPHFMEEDHGSERQPA